MKFYSKYITLPTLFLALSSTSVLALSAEDVWGSWKDLSSELGFEVEVEAEVKSGNELKVSTASFFDVDENGDGFGVEFESLTFTEQSDGSVVVTIDEAVSMGHSNEVTSLAVGVALNESQMVVSETTEGGLAYALTAEAIEVVYEQTAAAIEGVQEESIVLAGNATFGPTTLAYTDDKQDTRSLAFELTSEELVQSSTQKEPMLDMEISNEGLSKDIKVAGSVVIPASLETLDTDTSAGMVQALNDGFAASFMVSQGGGTMKSKTSGMVSGDVSTAFGPGSFGFDMNNDKMDLAFNIAGFELEGASEMLPIPVVATLKEIGMHMAMPMNTGTKASPYAFQFVVDELSVSEEAWALVDAANLFDHGPASVAFDVTGMMQGLFNPDGAGTSAFDPNWEPVVETVVINGIAASVAGAALEAQGEFEIDNSGGMPSPIGEANVSLSGLGQLLTGLQAVGILSEEDAAQATMMVQMMMVPGEGEDNFVSHIEAKAGNQLFVNGQQLQ